LINLFISLIFSVYTMWCRNWG